MTESWVITIPAWVAIVIPVAILVAVIAAGWRTPPEECQRRHVDDPPALPRRLPPLRLEDVPTNDLSRFADLERTRQIGPERVRGIAAPQGPPDDPAGLPEAGPWDPTVRRSVARVHHSKAWMAGQAAVRDEERRTAGGGS